jgi:hypothetical protein
VEDEDPLGTGRMKEVDEDLEKKLRIHSRE